MKLSFVLLALPPMLVEGFGGAGSSGSLSSAGPASSYCGNDEDVCVPADCEVPSLATDCLATCCPAGVVPAGTVRACTRAVAEAAPECGQDAAVWNQACWDVANTKSQCHCSKYPCGVSFSQGKQSYCHCPAEGKGKCRMVNPTGWADRDHLPPGWQSRKPVDCPHTGSGGAACKCGSETPPGPGVSLSTGKQSYCHCPAEGKCRVVSLPTGWAKSGKQVDCPYTGSGGAGEVCVCGSGTPVATKAPTPSPTPSPTTPAPTTLGATPAPTPFPTPSPTPTPQPPGTGICGSCADGHYTCPTDGDLKCEYRTNGECDASERCNNPDCYQLPPGASGPCSMHACCPPQASDDAWCQVAPDGQCVPAPPAEPAPSSPPGAGICGTCSEGAGCPTDGGLKCEYTTSGVCDDTFRCNNPDCYQLPPGASGPCSMHPCCPPQASDDAWCQVAPDGQCVPAPPAVLPVLSSPPGPGICGVCSQGAGCPTDGGLNCEITTSGVCDDTERCNNPDCFHFPYPSSGTCNTNPCCQQQASDDAWCQIAPDKQCIPCPGLVPCMDPEQQQAILDAMQD